MSAPEPAPPPSALHVRTHDSVPILGIPDALPFEELRAWVRAQLPEAVAELGGRAVRLDLGRREIQLFDVRRLLGLLREEFHLEVTGLYVQPEAIHRYAERELKLKLFPTAALPEEEPAAEVVAEATSELPGLADALAVLAGVEAQLPEVEPELPTDEPLDDVLDEDTDADAPARFEPALAQRRPIPLPDLPKDDEPDLDEQGGARVLSVRRTLRSGALVRYDGDVFVYGDVNAGAQIRAGGNIVVLGRLRGVAHAGALGDEGALILAFELAPTQLRIARHIAIAPERPPSEGFVPEMASVQGDQIVIEPYRPGPLRRR